MSKEFSRLFTAGLLTVAVVGGTAAYLTGSLAQSPAKYADSYTVEQSAQPAVHHAEVIVTEGRAS